MKQERTERRHNVENISQYVLTIWVFFVFAWYHRQTIVNILKRAGSFICRLGNL